LSWQHVLRLEGKGNYTIFVLRNGEQHLSTKSLCAYEPHLPENFIRIHKNCIVNQEVIAQVCVGSKSLQLSDGFETSIARRRWRFVKKTYRQSGKEEGNGLKVEDSI